MTDRDELIELLRKCTAYTEPLLADVILAAGFHKRPVGIPLSALLSAECGGVEITRHTPDCTWEELKELDRKRTDENSTA